MTNMLAGAVLVAAMLSQQEESKYVTTLKYEAGKASRKGSHVAAAADTGSADSGIAKEDFHGEKPTRERPRSICHRLEDRY
jgi:hypothetical protein